MRAERISTWRDRLQSHGLHVVDTFELADRIGVDPNERFRQDGLLVASRWPLHVLDPLRLNIPWPERVLSAAIEHPDCHFEIHTAHIPNASTGITLWRKDPELGRARLAKKTETMEGLYQGLALNPGTPKILTGDFNTPRFERNDGSVGYWQDSCPGPLKLELQQRWETAEHNVIQGLDAHAMRDVFRALHGYETEAFSWEAPNKKSRYRYDPHLRVRGLPTCRVRVLARVPNQQQSPRSGDGRPVTRLSSITKVIAYAAITRQLSETAARQPSG